MATTTNTSSTAISSGTSLTSQFYLKNFYRMNRNAIKVSTRKDYNDTELSYEDSRALKKAISKLGSYDYIEEENGDNLFSTIEAFTETYNNTLDSTDSEDSSSYRQNRKLKALTNEYADQLKDIGITIEKDGRLSISENVLKSSSFDSVKEVFAEGSNYMRELRHITRRMNDAAYDAVYAQMTGAGGKLNIIL